jgi:hypothetical protein
MPSLPVFPHLPEIALAAALAWGSGLRLYAVLFLIGLAGQMGWMELPAHLAVLAHPLVLFASGFMTLFEFSADKLPWLDSLWDALHTFIRVPAGAALAAAVFGADEPSIAIAAAILGGTIAAGTHLTKAGARATVNASPEPFSNLFVSLFEDLLVPVGMWLSVAHPVAFLGAFAVCAVLAVLLLRAIAGGLTVAARSLRTWKRPAGID